MKLRYAIVADYTNACLDGSVNLMGVRDRLEETKFPFKHPEIHFVFSLFSENGDEGRDHEIVVRLLTPDSYIMNELKGVIHVTEPRCIYNERRVIHGMTFITPGRYEFHVFLNGKMAGVAPLEIVDARPPETESR